MDPQGVDLTRLLQIVGAPGPWVARCGRALRTRCPEPLRSRLFSDLPDQEPAILAAAAMLGAALATKVAGPRAWLVGAVAAVWLRRRSSIRDQRQAASALLPALPPFIDRLAMCVMSGMNMDAALRLSGPGAPGALASAIEEGLSALRVGRTRDQAYDTIARTAGSADVAELLGALRRGERLGVSVVDTLVTQSRELRTRARALADAEIAAAPVKLVFPLVFCFLPAFVVLAIGPVAISAIRALTAL